MAKRILVVDDEAHILNILKFNIARAGYEVITAVNGGEAVDKLRTTPVDLILCDVMMPIKNGFEVCAEVKADPELKTIPFILLTAKGQRADEEQGIDLGVDAYLTKPFSPRMILQKIKEMIGEPEA